VDSDFVFLSLNHPEVQSEAMGAKAEQELHLYDPSLLLKIDFLRSPARFNPQITALAPGEPWLKVRPLKSGDYRRGFLQSLSQLTNVGEVSETQFLNRFAEMRAKGDYYVTVIEDLRSNKIIGSATLVIERKFIHSCGLRGHLEDVVVDDTYRGKQLGKLVIVTATLLGEVLGCYKMSLECKDKLIPFYRTMGYVDEKGNSNSMTLRFENQTHL